MFENKRILITGGTGSWGNELTTQLLTRNPREIRILSRGEFAQVTMQRKFNDPRLNFVIGDIRDYSSLEWACRDIDYVFHLAALKHVPICEEQPHEALKTNVHGTKNVIDAAIKAGVKKVIDVSTDKAVDPINLYGMSKAIAEKLIIQANKIPSSTKFVCIRGGNVMGSNGSVIPYFIDQIQRYGKITLTHKGMTRFFLTLGEAIGLLFKAAETSIGGETFVMHMPACKIDELADVLIEHYAPGKEISKTEIGMRPGEKIHEVLVSRYEAPSTYYFDDNYYLTLPTLHIDGLYEHYAELGYKKIGFEEFSSNSDLMKKHQIKAMLARGGFLK
ncbi:MAG: polysaccharide biosynthesis protein [Elusimicrobiaceae bacterium]